jgi:hypothetical protein
VNSDFALTTQRLYLVSVWSRIAEVDLFRICASRTVLQIGLGVLTRGSSISGARTPSRRVKGDTWHRTNVLNDPDGTLFDEFSESERTVVGEKNRYYRRLENGVKRGRG